MKYRTVKCVGCGKEIVRPVQTKKSKAKCRDCQRTASIERNKNYENIGKGQWTTASEIKFINQLRPVVARKYAVGLTNRVFWGDLDKHECINACRARAGF